MWVENQICSEVIHDLSSTLRAKDKRWELANWSMDTESLDQVANYLTETLNSVSKSTKYNVTIEDWKDGDQTITIFKNSEVVHSRQMEMNDIKHIMKFPSIFFSTLIWIIEKCDEDSEGIEA